MAQLSALSHHANLHPAPIRCSGGSSYLDMWRRAMERERQSHVLRGVVASPTAEPIEAAAAARFKEKAFHRLLQVPPEERDRAQSLQVIDRAAAAIAAARALLDEAPPAVEADDPKEEEEVGVADGRLASERPWRNEPFLTEFKRPDLGAPGPDFWSWSPPLDGERNSASSDSPQLKRKTKPYLNVPLLLMEKEKTATEHLPIPFESTLSQSEHNPPLPPLQSVVEVTKAESLATPMEELHVGEMFSRNAAEAAEALSLTDEAEASSHGIYSDGSRWWKETGVEKRPDGVVCKWTLTRGVSTDGTVEWEDKYWEASDQFDYKELGSEKSGRDAAGNVWHEFWRESLWQDLQTGMTHIENTADKRGKSGLTEWGEKWWEHYNSSGQAEKWADKWCSIDRNTPLEAGHAHVWHERWGENYDGKGASVKYTDKWAERWEVDGWSKWGDKWDEHFNSNGHGVKQGETWWQGKYGDRWNRTWGEGHSGSGWIHKYGKSSSDEHWDTHVLEDTWYERYPHFGFDHCLQNSVQLRAVPRQLPS